MPVDNYENQSYTANSSVSNDEFTRINIISRWCANKVQPFITQLNDIATLLDVDVRTIITPTK